HVRSLGETAPVPERGPQIRARIPGSVGARQPARLLERRAPALGLQPPALRRPGGLGRAPYHRWRDGLAQEGGEPLPRRAPVPVLGALLGRGDGEDSAGEPVGQLGEHALSLHLVERDRGGQVQAELDPGIGGVDSLPAGAGGVGELFVQLRDGHPQAAGRAGARCHAQIVHAPSVAERPARRCERRPRGPTVRRAGVAATRQLGHGGGMADPKKTLTSAEILDAVPAGWSQDGQTLTVRFATGDFATGLELVNRIGASAEEANHHPDLTLTYPEVTVTLSSHDVGGVTSRDLDLARRTSEHAAALDVAPAVD